MVDKNGVEMKTGDVVLISGAFFKNDNGLWFIERSPGDPSWCGSSYSLTKLKRNGQPSTAKYNLCSWPIAIFTNSWAKRNEAHAWNAEHAEIEVVKIADRSAIADHFMGLAKELDPWTGVRITRRSCATKKSAAFMLRSLNNSKNNPPDDGPAARAETILLIPTRWSREPTAERKIPK